MPEVPQEQLPPTPDSPSDLPGPATYADRPTARAVVGVSMRKTRRAIEREAVLVAAREAKRAQNAKDRDARRYVDPKTRQRMRIPMSADAPRVRRPRIIVTRILWEKMAAAYRDGANVRHVALTCAIPQPLAWKAVNTGFPSLRLPAIKEFVADPGGLHEKMYKIRQAELAPVEARQEATHRSAVEATASMHVLKGAVHAAEVSVRLAEHVLKLLKEDKLDVETVTPAVVVALTRAVEVSGVAVERALRIERLRTGEPEVVVGVQIGLLLNNCTPDELIAVRDTGRLPARILGLAAPIAAEDVRRPVIDAVASPGDKDAGQAADALKDEPVFGSAEASEEPDELAP